VLSDTHVGGLRFGHLPRRRSVEAPRDCFRGALREVVAWGASLVVVKGDVTDHGTAEHWEEAEAILAECPVPVVLTLGNHDVQRRAVPRSLAPVQVHDLPGLRVVVADSTLPRKHGGSPPLDALEPVADGRPTLLCFHHQLQRHRIPTNWPPGISGTDARAYLDRLVEVNPSTVVTTGHTHRHRVRRHGPIVVSETASTKDFPGTWTGFAVHEGGVRQVARRVAAPEAIAWTEWTASSFLGAWGRYSPGALEDRCYTHAW
jgi:predicted phosphodiesterase